MFGFTITTGGCFEIRKKDHVSNMKSLGRSSNIANALNLQIIPLTFFLCAQDSRIMVHLSLALSGKL